MAFVVFTFCILLNLAITPKHESGMNVSNMLNLGKKVQVQREAHPLQSRKNGSRTKPWERWKRDELIPRSIRRKRFGTKPWVWGREASLQLSQSRKPALQRSIECRQRRKVCLQARKWRASEFDALARQFQTKLKKAHQSPDHQPHLNELPEWWWRRRNTWSEQD